MALLEIILPDVTSPVIEISIILLLEFKRLLELKFRVYILQMLNTAI